MKKLKLDVDKLDVESFEAADEPAQRGTVEAQGIPYTDEQIGTCVCGTAACTVPWTCAQTCYIQETCEPGICF